MFTELAEAKSEIVVFIGQSKLIEAKRPFTRVVIANPAIADVQLLDADVPNPKLLNIYGRQYGMTNLTLWDDQDRVNSYLVRVTINEKDLEGRIKKIFPGAEVHVRQVGQNVILEGQVPDAKTMAEIWQLVTTSLLGYAYGAPPPAGAQAVGGAGGPGGAAPPGGAQVPGTGSQMTGMGGAVNRRGPPARASAAPNWVPRSSTASTCQARVR